jgi:hypothetical protein
MDGTGFAIAEPATAAFIDSGHFALPKVGVM